MCPLLLVVIRNRRVLKQDSGLSLGDAACSRAQGEVRFASYWALLCGFWSGEVHSALLYWYEGLVLATRSVGGSDMIPPCQKRHGISLDACYQGGTRKPRVAIGL